VQRSLRVPRLGDVNDMTSCKKYQCIYIADQVNCVIHRVTVTNAITQWPAHDVPHSLSVNSISNVLVTCREVDKVKEFTTNGRLMRAISIQSDIVHPLHTVQLTTGQFVLSHGHGNDPLHRVCVVDSSGHVVQSYGGCPGSSSEQMRVPARLAVGDGFMFVADFDNHRVLMLSYSVSHVGQVGSGPSYPLRIWYDDDTGRLYVVNNKLGDGKWASSHVAVYKVSK